MCRCEAATNQIPARKVPDLAAAVDFAVNKVLIVGDPEKDAPRGGTDAAAGLPAGCPSTAPPPFFLEVMPLGGGKGGLAGAACCATQGLFAENLMACGDGWNDLPMIPFAGLGVAMGNAVPQVKACGRLCDRRQRPRRRGSGGGEVYLAGGGHPLNLIVFDLEWNIGYQPKDLPLPRRRDHPAGRDHPDRCGAHRRARRRAGYL